MKVPAARADAFAAAPPPDIRAVLVYGPDRGLIGERARKLADAVLKGDADPFRMADISPDRLREEPGLLADEAAALSFTPGRRVIRVREASDKESKAAELLLANPNAEALTVIDAGDLPPRSALRKLFEGAENAAALPCYADDARTRSDVIRAQLQDLGKSADRDTLAYLVAHLGADRAMTRQEIEKLALYVGAEASVTIQDAMACVGDGTALELDDLIYAATDGDYAAAHARLDRLLAEGSHVIPILTALGRHVTRLHLVRSALDAGTPLDGALKALRPPLFFKVRDRFTAQVRAWSVPACEEGLAKITEAEIACKSTDMPAHALCGRLLISLAQLARKGRR